MQNTETIEIGRGEGSFAYHDMELDIVQQYKKIQSWKPPLVDQYFKLLHTERRREVKGAAEIGGSGMPS